MSSGQIFLEWLKGKGPREEDIDVFCGCDRCKSFAHNHVCVITPDRPPICGMFDWDMIKDQIGKKERTFEVPKGECLDPIKGEYAGVNKIVYERSNKSYKRFYLHSIFGPLHTSCGCFEAVAFYIKEVDGIGIVDRNFGGEFMRWKNIEEIVERTGGGGQKEGLMGIATTYLQSPKFLQGDGGWNRVVWMTERLKNLIPEWVPASLRERIATENNARSIEELKSFIDKNKGR
jgi:acetyl-CoA decarbonylase/synthase complex subunit beta